MKFPNREWLATLFIFAVFASPPSIGQTTQKTAAANAPVTSDAEKKNPDGVSMCISGRKPQTVWNPTGIPTLGKEPYVWLRLYGPEEAFWNKSFKMPDVEIVK
jgi:hypothetical protein